MKNSDFIQMSQCHIFSIKLPTENIKETLENAKFEIDDPYITLELVKNPMTGEKVQVLENGLFFTFRATFKKVTRELLSAKIYELKERVLKEGGLEDDFIPSSETEWKQIATAMIRSTVPYSSELINVFYSPEKELLFTNNHSKHARLALHHLIKTFGLAGFRSVVVSDEKLGLNTRLNDLLVEGKAMFNFLNFQYEVTLKKLEDGDETFLTCRHLANKDGHKKAIEALNNGFRVQSAQMSYTEEGFAIYFKLDSNLKIRSMRFAECADVSRQLNRPDFAGKSAAFVEYLDRLLNALLKIATDTVLEFVNDTKLESFV